MRNILGFRKSRSTRGDRRRKSQQSTKWGFRLLVLALVALLVFLFLIRDTSISYLAASANPQLRVEFTAQMVKQYPPPPRVERVQYGTTEILAELEREYNFIFQPYRLMDTVTIRGLSVEQFGQLHGPKVFITVFAHAFTSLGVKNKHDFASYLLHEYHHAELLDKREVAGFSYSQDFVIIEDGSVRRHHAALLTIIIEMEVNRTQIRNITSRDWSTSQILLDNRLEAQIDNYLNFLALSTKGPSIDPEIMERMKIEFFEPWFSNREEFSFTSDGAPEFINLKTGKSYTLPKEVLLK